MIEETKQSIQNILKTATNPVMAWSGGRDSNLLLYLARQINPEISIVWFKQNVSKEWQVWCESIIMDWDLTVFSFPVSDTYYLPNDQGLTLIDEYSFGSVVIPVLQDVKDGVECAANVSRETIPAFAYPWSETLTGYRETDKHSILGKHFFPEDGTQCGNTKLYAPLRTWIDSDVLQASKELGLPEPPADDRLPRCTNCLQGKSEKVWCPEAQTQINSINWNPNERLNDFRQRFLPASFGAVQNSELSSQGV